MLECGELPLIHAVIRLKSGQVYIGTNTATNAAASSTNSDACHGPS